MKDDASGATTYNMNKEQGLATVRWRSNCKYLTNHDYEHPVPKLQKEDLPSVVVMYQPAYSKMFETGRKGKPVKLELSTSAIQYEPQADVLSISSKAPARNKSNPKEYVTHDA
eukprot:3756523-Amphidinium_carterae.1